MVRMICWSWRLLCVMGHYLCQVTVLFLHFTYFILTLVGGFVAQLTLIGHVAVWFGTMEHFSDLYSLLILIPSDWRADCWRLFAVYGAFVWIGYILPAQRDGDQDARQRPRSLYPLRPVAYHALLWVLLWGPVAMRFELYTRIATPILALVFGGLVNTYYLYVWQGKVEPQLRAGVNRKVRMKHPVSLMQSGR